MSEERTKLNDSNGSMQPAIDLLTEVMDSHKDPNSADFNDCLDGRECQWCVEAKQWIEEQNTEIGQSDELK
jgi:hypothetical protein